MRRGILRGDRGGRRRLERGAHRAIVAEGQQSLRLLLQRGL
jgi:hypothetical protein